MQPQYISTHPQFKDLTGHTFGRLQVLEYAGRNKREKISWQCQCACGNQVIVTSAQLLSGRKLSCGCLHHDSIIGNKFNRQHGMSYTRVFGLWLAMLKRCTNPHAANYHLYGGRGISVCERWRSFENFYADMGEPPSDKHSLDRIDNDGNYTPDNCRWATKVEQAQNRRTTIQLTCNGITHTLREWSALSGISPELMRRRIRAGFSPERTIFEPSRKITA